MTRQIFVDCRQLTERSSAHDYLKEIMDFPVYYGRNLDALYDCLCEMGDCVIHLQYEQETHLAGTYGERIMEVLQEAAFENPALKLCIDNHLSDL